MSEARASGWSMAAKAAQSSMVTSFLAALDAAARHDDKARSVLALLQQP